MIFQWIQCINLNIPTTHPLLYPFILLCIIMKSKFKLFYFGCPQWIRKIAPSPFYCYQEEPSSKSRFGYLSVERPKLERQVLVNRKDCFIQEDINLEKWWTSVPGPSPKCLSEQEYWKGELPGHGDEELWGAGSPHWLATNQWLVGRLPSEKETVCFKTALEMKCLICGFQGAPSEIPETQKGLFRGQHGGNFLACFKMEWVRHCKSL